VRATEAAARAGDDRDPVVESELVSHVVPALTEGAPGRYEMCHSLRRDARTTGARRREGTLR